MPASGLDFPVVGVGASAGGLAAIKTLLESLPAEPDMAFVVVLHLSPVHESNAASILQTVTRMPVAQVTGKLQIERNHVYVIPPTQDLVMFDGALSLEPSRRTRGRHVVIDHFFRTLAEAHRERAIGIVLSGTGADGSLGIASVKAHGGVVIAQSPSEAEYDGMPSSAIATGKADIVLPVADIADRLLKIWGNARQIELPAAPDSDLAVKEPARPEAAEESLLQVLRILLKRTGHDFQHYKRATVLRRIERRLQVNSLTGLPSYLAYLKANPREADALFDDMLIGVTQFFRDRAAFETLERKVVPDLFERGDEDGAIRAWVAGCSTGEEAYSIAMLLAEEAPRTRRQRKLTLFATDINRAAIDFARGGVYSEPIVADMAPARQRMFFLPDAGGYRIIKAVRDTLIFAVHNLLRDPPFSRLDLVCCRNVLIYLDQTAQEAVLDRIHFALRPGGYLFLGTSETADAQARLFTPVDKSQRIYRANPVGRPIHALASASLSLDMSLVPSSLVPALEPAKTLRNPTAASVHQSLLEQFAPPSVLVSTANEILHVSGSASAYLRYAEGEPSNNLIDAAPSDFRSELRTALFQAQQLHTCVESPPVRAVVQGRRLQFRISARPVRHEDWPGELLLVNFLESDEADGSVPPEGAGDGDPALARLARDLEHKSEQLGATIEQYETSAEELRASNEELQAINEELRSATEELETSKEELQSTNEELITVNHELKTKIEETSEINDDLKNLITSSDIATVFVDPAMRIKRFTPAAASLFNIIAADVGRSLFDITHRLEYDALADDARAVFTTLKTIEREVLSADGRRLLARLLPYRTTEDRIGGAVLSFVDVTVLRQAQDEASIGAERMAVVAEAMTDFAFLTLDLEGRFTSWSAGAVRLFGYERSEAMGRPFELIFNAADRANGAPTAEMREADGDGRAPDERWFVRKDGRTFFASGYIVRLRAGGVDGYAKICRDMTQNRTVEERRERDLADAQRGAAAAAAESELKSEFLAVMSHELKHPLNLISVNAQLLTTLPEARTSAALQRATGVIQRTVQSQARIIDDLLDLSRTQTGKLKLEHEPLLLIEAIQPCINWALGETRKKGMQLYVEGFDDPIVVEGDPVRIEQIAWNLLSNAVKFSRNGGAIIVRAQRDDGFARLSVTDSGHGIEPAFLPQVFEMFKQADSRTTRVEGGLGIGLALVKNLVEMHGGRVTAESAGLGQGATFSVWLPLHEATDHMPLDGSNTPARQPLAGVRVLLVDDMEDTLETFGYLLQHEGADVTAASSGAEALRLAEEHEFDLVISDVGMPRMDGYQLLTELRNRPRTVATPAIALTGYGRANDIERALKAGFQAHVDKPVNFERMRVVIEEVLAGASIAGNLSDSTSKGS